MTGRWIALDYGRARIGVATSDRTGVLASPKAAVFCKKGNLAASARLIWLEIQKLTQEDGLGGILLGLPLHLDGQEGEMAREVRLFAGHLQAISSQPVHFIDERLSSAQAEKLLSTLPFSRKERAARSDSAAATLLLQTFLDTKKPTS